MPWSVKKSGDKWAIVTKGSGEVVGHSDSKEKAEASVRAMYANEGKGKKKKRTRRRDMSY
jgi:hypothetical protein